jgi:hypothetical protein
MASQIKFQLGERGKTQLFIRKTTARTGEEKKKEEKNQRKHSKGSEPDTQAVESSPDPFAPADASIFPGNA